MMATHGTAVALVDCYWSSVVSVKRLRYHGMCTNQLNVSIKVVRSKLVGSVLEYQLLKSTVQCTKSQDNDKRKTGRIGQVANVVLSILRSISSRGCEHHDACISDTSFALSD